MRTTSHLKESIRHTLTLGMLLSMLLVLIGGIGYLFEQGSNSLQTHLQTWSYQSPPFHLTPEGFIELGLLVLIFMQVLRVLLLIWFYIRIKDMTFFLINLFVLIILCYSLFRGFYTSSF